MSKDVKSFSFEPSASPQQIQMHLTDEKGENVTYRLDVARLGRFLGGIFDQMEALGEQMKRRDPVAPPSETLRPDAAWAARPSWVRWMDKSDGGAAGEEPCLLMHFGSTAISFQIDRENLAKLLAQGMDLWPASKEKQ